MSESKRAGFAGVFEYFAHRKGDDIVKKLLEGLPDSVRASIANNSEIIMPILSVAVGAISFLAPDSPQWDIIRTALAAAVEGVEESIKEYGGLNINNLPEATKQIINNAKSRIIRLGLLNADSDDVKWISRELAKLQKDDEELAHKIFLLISTMTPLQISNLAEVHSDEFVSFFKAILFEKEKEKEKNIEPSFLEKNRAWLVNDNEKYRAGVEARNAEADKTTAVAKRKVNRNNKINKEESQKFRRTICFILFNVFYILFLLIRWLIKKTITWKNERKNKSGKSNGNNGPGFLRRTFSKVSSLLSGLDKKNLIWLKARQDVKDLAQKKAWQVKEDARVKKLEYGDKRRMQRARLRQLRDDRVELARKRKQEVIAKKAQEKEDKKIKRRAEQVEIYQARLDKKVKKAVANQSIKAMEDLRNANQLVLSRRRGIVDAKALENLAQTGGAK